MHRRWRVQGGGGVRGVMGVRTPLPLLGDPKTSKRGENDKRLVTNVVHFST